VGGHCGAPYSIRCGAAWQSHAYEEQTMKIVVTGSRGKLGAAAVAYARQQGAEVREVDRAPYQIGSGPLGQYLSADLTDLGQVYDVLAGADAVIHLAAIVSQRLVPSERTFRTNTGITWNVLEAAARLGLPRVVCASSVQVNSTVTPRTPLHYDYLPLDEDHAVSPQDDYGMSKLVGEQLATMFAAHWGLTTVSFRFPWIASAEEFAGLPLAGPPRPEAALYAYIHIEDAARACYLAATAALPPRSHSLLFVSASDTSLDMPSLEYVRAAFPAAAIRPGLEGYGSLLNCARAAALLGFTPAHSARLAQHPQA
jgi:nucleoside-diphosphate-sugar epimerase